MEPILCSYQSDRREQSEGNSGTYTTLSEALTGRSHPIHRQMLALQLERLRLLEEQLHSLNSLLAQAMKAHQNTVLRLAQVPGLGIDSAHQGDRRGGSDCEFLPIGSRVHLLGRNLSRQRGKRRTEPQQPISERQQVHTTPPQSGSS